MDLSDDALREIGIEAARETVGNVGEVRISAGADADGIPAYFYEIYLQQDGDRRRAVLARMRLFQSIRDRLVAAQDEHYPYIQVIDRSAETALAQHD